jgi:arylsulfatase
VLLIVADDLGYTDISPYGSEIETPTLDSLAGEGILFSQFYTSAMCSPTRSMLLSGLDNHRAGFGNLKERMADNQRGRRGYEGYLAPATPTLAERLSAAGYRTYMAGKWHLGEANGADPASRGFDRHFALHDSGASHFSDMLSLSGPGKVTYAEDGQRVQTLPEDFYSTRFYTDKIIEYLAGDAGDERPFFAYVAYTAPHFPLQAPAQSIARYRGRYAEGYSAIAARRHRRAVDLGLIPGDSAAFPGAGTEPAWGDLDEPARSSEARAMEIYAGMVDFLDSEIGRLLGYLEEQDLRDNTLIIFMSDNGAEGHRLNQGMGPLYDWQQQCCDNSLENMGSPGSYVVQGPNWATVSATPFRMFKGFVSEGGIRVPAIISPPGGLREGRVYSEVAMVTDILPTIMDVLEIDVDAATLDGRSLAPAFRSAGPALSDGDDRVVAWELLGKRAVRRGPWKIVHESPFVDWWDMERIGARNDAWQLYNLDSDPAELTDLSKSEPERLAEMIGLWDAYAGRNGVVLPASARNY